jgi:hypothetical protein
MLVKLSQENRKGKNHDWLRGFVLKFKILKDNNKLDRKIHY